MQDNQDKKLLVGYKILSFLEHQGHLWYSDNTLFNFPEHPGHLWYSDNIIFNFPEHPGHLWYSDNNLFRSYRIQTDWVVKLTTHIHLVLRLRMSGDILLLPQNACTAWAMMFTFVRFCSFFLELIQETEKLALPFPG